MQCGLCIIRPYSSNMRLKEIGQITIGSRFRESTSCVFVSHPVGANLVCLRPGHQDRVIALKLLSNYPHARNQNVSMARSLEA